MGKSEKDWFGTGRERNRCFLKKEADDEKGKGTPFAWEEEWSKGREGDQKKKSRNSWSNGSTETIQEKSDQQTRKKEEGGGEGRESPCEAHLGAMAGVWRNGKEKEIKPFGKTKLSLCPRSCEAQDGPVGKNERRRRIKKREKKK